MLVDHTVDHDVRFTVHRCSRSTGPGPSTPGDATKEDDVAKTDVVVKDDGALTADDLDMGMEGRENLRQEERKTPFLVLLQAQSRQCLDSKPENVPGARAGMGLDTASQA